MSIPQGFWDSKNEVSGSGNPAFSFKNVKDFVRGYLVKKSLRKNDLKAPVDGEDVYQRVYTLAVKDGEEYECSTKNGAMKRKGGELIDVYGKMLIEARIDGKRVQIIKGGEDVELGTMVGFMFTEEIPPTKKGNHPTKIVKCYADADDVNKDLVKSAAMSKMKDAEGAKPEVSKDDEVPFND